MLQLRERGSDGDRRWYSPSRDICYAFPRTLRKSLESFNDFKGTADVSVDDLGKACGVLGKVVQGCREGRLAPKEAIFLLKSIPQPARALLGDSFIFTFFAELLVWCSEVRPKSQGDVPIPTEELEAVLGEFARSARRGSEDSAEKIGI